MPKTIYTYEICLAAAKRYEYIIDWMNSDFQTYHKAFREKWLNKIIRQSGIKRRKRKNITYKFVLKIAKRYPTIKDWYTNDWSSYDWAHKNGHLPAIKKEVNFSRYGWVVYTFEECEEDAKQFNNIAAWRKNQKTYNYAKSQNWVQKIADRVGMKKGGRQKNWWFEAF